MWSHLSGWLQRLEYSLGYSADILRRRGRPAKSDRFDIEDAIAAPREFHRDVLLIGPERIVPIGRRKHDDIVMHCVA